MWPVWQNLLFKVPPCMSLFSWSTDPAWAPALITFHLGRWSTSWWHRSPRSYHPTAPLSLPYLGCVYFVPYFLLFSLPANHFSAGNDPTQNCFKSFLEHVKIGKQNKTENKSLLGFQTQAPGCLPRVLPDPGDRAHRTVTRHTLFSHRARSLWPWGGQGPGLTHPPGLLSQLLSNKPGSGRSCWVQSGFHFPGLCSAPQRLSLSPSAWEREACSQVSHRFCMGFKTCTLVAIFFLPGNYQKSWL